MAPRTSRPREVFQCVEPFAIWRDGVPQSYGHDSQVLAEDPILKSHPRHFVPAADRVEAMTAAPGERRSVHIPDPDEIKEPDDG